MQLLRRRRQICLWHWSALSEFYISLQAFYICYFVFCLKRAPKTVSASDPPKSGYTFGPNPLGRQTHSCELTEVHSIVVRGKRRIRRYQYGTWGAWWTGLDQNDEFEKVSQVILICFPLLRCTLTPCSTHKPPILHSHAISLCSFKALKPVSLSDED